MGIPIAPHPKNKTAIQQFDSIKTKAGEASALKRLFCIMFGHKVSRRYGQWQADYLVWRGEELLIDTVFIGEEVVD